VYAISDRDDEVLLLDGGLATELERRGYDISGSLWSARLLQSAPHAIEQLHYDYYAAGADFAITASYQASFEGFATRGIGAGQAAAMLRRSVELARSARARYRHDHPDDQRPLHVAASVGPYGAVSHDGAEYRGDYRLTIDELAVFHARRLEVLAMSGADILACETVPLLDEARALVVLLERHPDVPAWVSFTSPDGVHTSHGERLEECARFLDGVANVVAVGVNCLKPAAVAAAIRSLRGGTKKRIVVYPNSGERWDGGTRDWQGAPEPSSLAALAPRWIEAGARWIGGCCRVGPAEIAQLRRACPAANPRAEPVKTPR
jgi:homocysteine S-methyltransferase